MDVKAAGIGCDGGDKLGDARGGKACGDIVFWLEVAAFVGVPIGGKLRQPPSLFRLRRRLLVIEQCLLDLLDFGRWIDTDGDGRYDVLEIETRNLRGPRTWYQSGMPMHADNETVIKERIYLDKGDRNILHDEMTTFDHSLTRPWSVMKNYRRDPNPRPNWTEEYCEDNNHVIIGNNDYMLSADGLLMPAKKDQTPPDWRYFNQSRK